MSFVALLFNCFGVDLPILGFFFRFFEGVFGSMVAWLVAMAGSELVSWHGLLDIGDICGVQV